MIQPAFQMPARPSVPGPKPPPPRMDAQAQEYRDLRAEKERLQKQLDDLLAPIKERMSQIENELLETLNTSGMNSINTPCGTIIRNTRRSYSIDDPVAFRNWVESNSRPDFYENRASKEALDNYLETGADLPPGVKVNSFTTVQVRAPR